MDTILSEQVGSPDVLSEVLRDIRIEEVSCFCCSLSCPWGIAFPAQPALAIYYVAAGTTWLRIADDDWTELHAGDTVVLPHGASHTLADTPGRSAQSLATLPLERTSDHTARLTAGGDGAKTLLLCCTINPPDPHWHPLLELSPPALVLHGEHARDPVLPMLLRTMADEAASARVGGITVLARLADVVLARAIRSWVEQEDPNMTGWVAALRDPHLGRALAAIHRHPGHPWSVETLAELAGASRSTFSERFTALVGSSPARYVARWRMHIARRWLRTEQLTVAEVAARLGYESEAAFSRAFKRVVGVPPSALRRGETGERRAA